MILHGKTDTITTKSQYYSEQEDMDIITNRE